MERRGAEDGIFPKSPPCVAELADPTARCWSSNIVPTKRKPCRASVLIRRCSCPKIADRISGGVEASRQRRIGHDASIPDRVDKIVLADDAIPIADQVIKQSENLTRYGDNLGPRCSFTPLGIERIIC